MPKHTRIATRLATITTMAAAATLALAACGQSAAQPASGGETGAAKDTIVVAAVPAEESANLHAQFDGINKELEKAMSKEERKKMDETYEPKVEEIGKQIEAEMKRITTEVKDPAALMKLGAAMAGMK